MALQDVLGISVALTGGPPPFNAVLAAISAALAGAQLAAIVATPIPKFAKGTKKAKGGLSMVGEKGTELMYVPGEAKILPNDKTRKYGDIIDAMYDSRLDNYILKNYIAPALKKQQQVNQSFAQNVTASIDTMKLAHDIAYVLRDQGVVVKNAEAIGRAISDSLPSDNIRRR